MTQREIEYILCRACGEPFMWTPGKARRPHFCKAPACVKRRSAGYASAYYARKWKGAPTVQPRERGPVTPPEPTHVVERLLEAARRRRLREERATGQRRHTIENGWIQRPGAGEANFGADAQGWGFR